MTLANKKYLRDRPDVLSNSAVGLRDKSQKLRMKKTKSQLAVYLNQHPLKRTSLAIDSRTAHTRPKDPLSAY